MLDNLKQAAEDKANEPDCFDLNDWAANEHPDFIAFIRYLQPSVAYDLTRALWVKMGRPEIRG